METQRTISLWAIENFGDADNVMALITRLNLEMAELLHSATTEPPAKTISECADVLIVLYQVAEWLGVDLNSVVDAKMEVNRSRTWVKTANGVGRHV